MSTDYQRVDEPNPKKRAANVMKGKHRFFYESVARRNRMVELISSGMLIKEALQHPEVKVRSDTYRVWRRRYPEFAARIDAARSSKGMSEKEKETYQRPGGSAAFDFAQERLRWFGHQSPPFQLEVVQAMSELAPGNVLLVLLPPLHGKTTMYEDWATLQLAYHPNIRMHVGSETRVLSVKVLSRIRDRIDPVPGSKFQEFVQAFGPFAPPKGPDAKRHRQPWQEGYFDIWRRSIHDERDYSMTALGFGSQIIGSRSDWLHCDDLQSRETLGQTEKNFDKWRQDWLSRPADEGRTTVMGNRVDEGDIYEAMMEELDSDILHIIRYPAIVERQVGTEHIVEPLWPGRHTMASLEKAKRKFGPATFERNWMQRPRAKGQLTFDQGTVDACLDPLRPAEQPDLKDRICYIGLDPGLDSGITALVAIAIRATGGFDVVAARQHVGLQNNESIMLAMQALHQDLLLRGAHVTDWVIEAKNFQAGLVRDQRLQEMREGYGVIVSEHMTGWNKYDENIGVASMVTTFIKRDISIPWFDDETGYTRATMGNLRTQLMAWRPFKKGTKLRQDLVMALWFAWIKWRQRKGSDLENFEDRSSPWKTHGSPYTPTATGLLIPIGAYPSILSGR